MMKAIIGALTVLLLAGCATTWVEPRLNLKGSRISVECVDDPLGLTSKIENQFHDAGIDTQPSDTKSGGDLILKVAYKFTKSDGGLNSIRSIKAQMVDPRYNTVVARYEWGGEDNMNTVAQRLTDALLGR